MPCAGGEGGRRHMDRPRFQPGAASPPTGPCPPLDEELDRAAWEGPTPISRARNACRFAAGAESGRPETSINVIGDRDVDVPAPRGISAAKRHVLAGQGTVRRRAAP